VFCAVADEENESAGLRHALPRIALLKRRFDVRGVVNVDYVTRTESGRVPVYAGTIGKALVGVFARGLPAHAGDPLRGVDAGLLVAEAIREIDLDLALADRGAAPPVTLRFGDLMGAYNVQTPNEAFAFFNLLFRDGDLRSLLARFEAALRRAAAAARGRLSRRGVRARIGVSRWSRLSDRARPAAAASPGTDGRKAAIEAVSAAARERGGEPSLVLFLAPPFYPPDDGSRSGELIAAFERAVAGRKDEFEVRRFYPYVSDMSLLALSPLGTRALRVVEKEMPVGHGLPVSAMRAVDLPALNVGPVGTGAHEKTERVETRFAFDALPSILERLAAEVVTARRRT
jgi:arginine utilization protein RocB